MIPRLLAERLNAAAAARTPVTVLYRDGNREMVHKVLPLAASTRVLRAVDLTSNQMRVFLLNQLEILEGMDDRRTLDPSPTAPARPQRDREILASLIDELKQLGWHVILAGDRLSVHLTYSDGKPIKIASAFVARRRSAKGGSVSTVSRRPWTVVAPGIPKARTFVTLDKAAALFMAQLRLHSPAHRGRRPGPQQR